MDDEQKLEYLYTSDLCSEETINYAIGVDGKNSATIDKIVYYFTGYQTFEQLYEERQNEN